MNARTATRRSLALVAIAAAGLIALSGCKIGGGKDATSGTPTSAPTAAEASAKASSNPSGKPSAKSSASKKPGGNGALPDVCTLLTRAEVGAMAGGKQVAQVDPDGAKPGDTVRHCQWQMNGARLAIFLSPTTPAEFTQAHGKSQAVSGVGDAAYMSSGHLYVRHGNILIDVYATSGTDAAGEKLAKTAALKIIERL
jgi:hypothetical protein